MLVTIGYFIAAVVGCLVITSILGMVAWSWPSGVARLVCINTFSFFAASWLLALVTVLRHQPVDLATLHFCLVPQALVFIFSLGAHFRGQLAGARGAIRPRTRPKSQARK